jgi:hypothetical protein
LSIPAVVMPMTSLDVAVCDQKLLGAALGDPKSWRTWRTALKAASHVIFQDLDWVPANHLQAEDRAYRLGQTDRVTVEYMLADGTLDVFIASLLEAKLRLINTIESDEVPNASRRCYQPVCTNSKAPGT